MMTDEHFEEFEEFTSSAPVSAALPSSGVGLSRKAESLFGGLWASLFFSGRMSGNTILLTSATEGEGVSTLACGLAVYGSERKVGAGVALVDFNLRSPTVHRLLGLPRGPGLTDAVSGNLADVVAMRVNENLHVYTAGEPSGRALDLLRNSTTEAFFQSLSEEYENVIIDAAPVNHYPDASVLGGMVTDVALVVQTNRTTREAVMQAKKSLDAGGGNVIGTILNKRTFPIPGFLYRRL